MSKQRASGSPAAAAAQAAPAAPPAGPESTVSAACAPAWAALASPPEDCMTAGSRQPRLARALDQPAKVGAQQRGEGGVDLGGGRALELAERADGLVRERDVHARQPLRERVAERALVRGVAVGVQQADGDRLGLVRGDRLDRGLEAASLSARSGPSGPIRSAAPTRRCGGTSGAGWAAQSR